MADIEPPKRKKRIVTKKLGRPLFERELIAPFEKAFTSRRAIAAALKRHESLVSRWGDCIPVKYADQLVAIMAERNMPPVKRRPRQ